MAQHRYLPPAYRNLGSTKSRIRRVLQESPRVAQIWREVSRRMDELHDAGYPDDPDLIAKDPEILMLVDEIGVELWDHVVEGGPSSGTVLGPIG